MSAAPVTITVTHAFAALAADWPSALLWSIPAVVKIGSAGVGSLPIDVAIPSASIAASLERVVADVVGLQFVADLLAALAAAIHTARGWAGLSIVFAYSFLIAFVLPGPSEVVLAAPLDLGIGLWPTLSVIMLVSATGKAVGSVFAFHIGQEAKEAGPVIRFLERSRFDVMAWSRARTVGIARRYGYAGLAVALMVPFSPDTLSIYAFAVLERDYWRFAAATFAGSLGRLVVTVGLFSGTLAVF